MSNCNKLTINTDCQELHVYEPVDKVITIAEPVDKVITIKALGPQGPQGPQGDVGPQGPSGSFPTTGSYTLTGSLVVVGTLRVEGVITGSLYGTSSWANDSISASYAITASHVSTVPRQAVTSSYPISTSGSSIYSTLDGTPTFSFNRGLFLGSQVGIGAISASEAIFLGYRAGFGATNARNSVFLGLNAGSGAINADQSLFIGDNAGLLAFSASNATFLGANAGFRATEAESSVFVGTSTGFNATFASHSFFIGTLAGGYATGASYSTFIGFAAGNSAASASYSTLIGYRAGIRVGSSTIGSNNIIIGTNITLESNRRDSINIGGIIFGTGSYFNLAQVSSGSNQGRIGINQPLPAFELDVSGSERITGNLIVSGAVYTPVITGSLFGTASWAQNAVTASYIDASGVKGLSLFRIATGSISASLDIAPDSLFLINSGFTKYLNISASGNTDVYSDLFIIHNLTTKQPVLTVSQSIVKIATQSLDPTGTTDAGSIWFTNTAMYVGLE